MNIKKVVKYIISLAICAVLLFFCFREVDWTSFGEGLRSCSWWFVGASMLCSILAFWFRGERWKLLLRPIDPTMDSLTTFDGVTIGYVANMVLPRAGELVRCGFIHRRSYARHPDEPEKVATFDKAAGTVLLSRSWDVLVVLIFFIILVLARREMFGGFFFNQFRNSLSGGSSLKWLIIGAAVLVAVIAFVILARKGENSIIAKIVSFVKGVGTGFVSFRSMEHKFRFLILTALLWTMYWLMSYFIILSMPALSALGPVDALFVCIVGSFAWMIPVPGGFGAYHGAVALALSAVYGVAFSTDGLMCATLNHEAQTLSMLICGGVSYLIETFRTKA